MGLDTYQKNRRFAGSVVKPLLRGVLAPELGRAERRD
jgi:hypothetical protein